MGSHVYHFTNWGYLQGVFDMTENGWKLVEIADGVTVQDIVEATECDFTVSLISEFYTQRVTCRTK